MPQLGISRIMADAPKALQVFIDDEGALGVLFVSRVSEVKVDGSAAESESALGITSLFIKGKVIMLVVYASSTTAGDLQWIRGQTRAWIASAMNTRSAWPMPMNGNCRSRRKLSSARTSG